MNAYCLAIDAKITNGEKVTHTELINALLLALGERPDLGNYWKRNTGAYQTEAGYYIKYGIEGGADIEGLMPPNGKHIEIEGKVGKDRQRKEQKDFQVVIEKNGGVYILARDIESVLKRLEEVCRLKK